HDHDHDHHDEKAHAQPQEKNHDHDEHEHHDDHEQHETHKEQGSHGEFTVEYHYQCGQIDQLEQIETQWFSLFPSTEKVHANILTDTQQKAADLNSKNTTIKL
ncbi:DUF2796 domain-containing protein, partial [Vibrio renipiscarius]|uniref:ZrgA family zinc uptake protein n=1 Tax=Vibrio renipiscarius TaxID=1461322 RepID=UPI00354ADE25